MREIPLTRSMVAFVDDEDFERVNQYKWQAIPGHSGFYASHRFHRKEAAIPLHRFILCVPAGTLVDHKNRNTLDNQKNNLRVCTREQNGANAKKRNGSSRFKGVYWHKQHGKWISTIQTNKRRMHVGLYRDEEQAARAYDAAAIKYHGEFASTNASLGLFRSNP